MSEVDVGPDWRLFVAVGLPDDVRTRLAEAVTPVAEANAEHFRWTDAASWHVTLAFLGSVDPSACDPIEEALWNVAGAVPRFDAQPSRSGRFGRGVLWLGFDDPSYASLVTLGEAVRAILPRIGIPFDERPLHPHLTLARQRDRRGIGVSRSRLAEVDEAVGPIVDDLRFPVTRVSLYRSHLGPDGARYEPIAHAPLARAVA